MYRIIPVLIVVLNLIHADRGRSNEIDRHVWRGEYVRALAAATEAQHEERAVYLTMAGRLAEASRILASRHDRFHAGIVAFKAERDAEALRALAAPAGNLYLEVYRGYIRGTAYRRTGRLRAARVAFDTLFSLIEAHPDLEGHPLIGRIVDGYAELIIRTGVDGTEAVSDFPHADALSGRSRFLLAKSCIDAGYPDRGERWFFYGMETPYDTSTAAPFAEAAETLWARFETYERDRLFNIAAYALHRAESAVAERIVTCLNGAFGDDHAVALLNVRYRAGRGEVTRALALARRLFDSAAPVDLKKEALLETASLEYRLGRLGSAAGSYRLFGMYYPTDARSVKALDLAARIEVARGALPRALSIWRTLRHRRARSKRARQAALSEAVLRFVRGARRDAHRILEDLLPLGDDAEVPAVIYWLYRTAGTDGDASRWRERLVRDHPRSFYASAAGGEDGYQPMLDIGSWPGGETPDRLASMEKREREIFETVRVALPPSDDLLIHPAFEAYRYFRSRGMLNEALECATTLVKRFGGDRDRMVVLYRDARANGMIDFALSVANTPALFAPGGALPTVLRYPVCFTGAIAENAARRDVPATLVLAVIREESRFNPTATSRAGAVGLMQLMPATGSWLASKIDVDSHCDDNLRLPGFSIAAGTWYLRYLLDRYEGSTVAALAAYNAGHARLKSWAARFDPARRPIAAIEMIGIRETRAYVKRVLDAMAAYRYLYGTGGGDES